MRISRLSLAGAIVLTSLVSQGAAQAHEPYFRENGAAICDTPKLVKTIQGKFRTQAKRVHHRPDWEITGLSDIHEHRVEAQNVHAGRPIERRYCHATAHFNDHTSRTIWYLIEGGAGFAGFGGTWLGVKDKTRNALGNGPLIHNVEFCIEGLDRWNVYNNHCRTLR